MTPDLGPGIVVTRSREPEGLRTMMMVSSVAHTAVVAALVAGSWVLGPRHPAEEKLMQISFPAMPGLVHELTAPHRREPKLEEMLENVTKASPAPAAQKPSVSTKPAPPTTAPELHPASSPVDTGSTSNEGGLAMRVLPGVNTQGTSVNFCDSEYLGQMASLIHRNWQQNQNVGGKPVVRFVILRDGTLTEITLRQPSGYPGLDLAAMRAVTLTRAIPPLPACYPHPHYAMNLTFEYIR